MGSLFHWTNTKTQVKILIPVSGRNKFIFSQTMGKMCIFKIYFITYLFRHRGSKFCTFISVYVFSFLYKTMLHVFFLLTHEKFFQKDN